MYFADKLILKRKIQSRFNSDMVFIKGFVVPFKNFSLIWRCHHYRWKAANFDLIVFSALIANDQWGFFSVPRLLWHGTSVYNGHLWGPMTLTPVAERLAVELSQAVLTTKVCRSRDSNTQPFACDANALTDRATALLRCKHTNGWNRTMHWCNFIQKCINFFILHVTPDLYESSKITRKKKCM